MPQMPYPPQYTLEKVLIAVMLAPVINCYYDGLLISISPDVPDPGKKGIGALELEPQLRGKGVFNTILKRSLTLYAFRRWHKSDGRKH